MGVNTLTKLEQVNSEEYWDQRFQDSWEANNGEKQSAYFANLALTLMPKWFSDYFQSKRLSLCDWGCAEGEGTEVLARNFPHNKVTGIDFADTAILKAKNKSTQLNSNYVAVDLLTQPHNATYDVVFASNIFEHFNDPWDTFTKISRFSSRFMVVLVPFNEYPGRIPEHFYSFLLNNVPMSDSEWTLMHFKVTESDPAFWPGQQAMMIFASQDMLADLQLHPSDLEIHTYEFEQLLQSNREKERELTEIALRHKKETADLKKEITWLRRQVAEDWKVINSKRVRAANKAADTFNKALKPGSRRRKAFVRSARATFKAAHATSKAQHYYRRRRDKEQLLKAVAKYDRIIVQLTMPWQSILKQRPHHLMTELANLNQFSVYIGSLGNRPEYVRDDLVVFPGLECLEYLKNLKGKKKMYFIIAAHNTPPYRDLKKFQSMGFEIIYEYIDDLHEDIFGSDLSSQLNVFNKIKSLRPFLILASAKNLFNEMVDIVGKKKVLFNQNAVDPSHFYPKKIPASKIPKDMKAIVNEGKPIVGYYGAIAPWLDYKLIREAVLAKPDMNFVFIGLEYNKGTLRHLGNIKNLHYLGPKDYQTLPDYANLFDCTIIPFKRGNIAKSTSPVKLFEYMAMALPTVCTRDLRECMGYEGILMSKDNKDFIANLERAVKLRKDKTTAKKLLEYANQNTWAARAESILNKLIELEA